MHKAYTCLCLICEACNTSTLTWIFFQWIWGTQNTNNFHLDLCSFSLFVEISIHFIRLTFSPFVTSHGFLLRACSSLYFWRILIKFRDALNFSTGMVFIIISAGFSSCWSLPNRSSYHPWSTDVSCEISHQCALFACDTCDLLARWIALWLS